MESFRLFNRNTFLGTISYDRLNDKYLFKKSDAKIGFPPTMSEPPIRGIPKEVIEEQNIIDFIEDRIFPSNRQGIRVYLDFLDLLSYDEWEIFVRNSGMSYMDYYWIDSCGATDFSQHVRNGKDFPYQLNKDKR